MREATYKNSNAALIQMLQEAVDRLAMAGSNPHHFELCIDREKCHELATAITNEALRIEDSTKGWEHVPVDSVA